MSASVLLGVTGSIAAYKAAEIVRLMRAREWDVRVIMTASAVKFIGELTLRTLSRNPVAIAMFPETGDWVPQHVALADAADAYVIAPCSANVMAKLAHGIADDMVTCTALSCRCPLLLAPAMNEAMWEHPATRANVEILSGRGVGFVDVGTGDLACGYEGKGRMAESGTIVARTAELLKE